MDLLKNFPKQLVKREQHVTIVSKLIPDILLMIIGDLQHSKPTDLTSLRLTSKHINDLVLPIIYRYVLLHDRIVCSLSLSEEPCELMIHQLKVAHDVRIYARNITIDRRTNTRTLTRILLSFENLITIKYVKFSLRIQPFQQKITYVMNRLAFSDRFVNCKSCYTAATAIDDQELRRKWPNLRYSVECLDTTAWYSHMVGSLPASTVTSCKVKEWFGSHRTAFTTLKNLLPDQSCLETLYLVSRKHHATIRDRDIADTDRLPPVLKLVLRGYNWNHSPAITIAFWNWSRLTHLELERVSILRFLQTVPVECLLQLQVFIADRYCSAKGRDVMTLDLLCNLVSQVKALRKLRMKSKFDGRYVPAILKQGKSLMSLDVRESTEYASIYPWINTRTTHQPWRSSSMSLQISQLTAIGEQCPHLMELTLDKASFAYKVVLLLMLPFG